MQLIDCFLWMLMEQITLVNPTGWECYLPFTLTVILTPWVLVFQVFEPVICHPHSRFWFNLIPEQEKKNKTNKKTNALSSWIPSVMFFSYLQYSVWCLVWFGINLFIISLYLEIDRVTHVSTLTVHKKEPIFPFCRCNTIYILANFYHLFRWKVWFLRLLDEVGHCLFQT